MPRKASSEPLIRVGIAMFQRDWERLGAFYPNKGNSAVVRSLIRAHLLKIDKHFQAAVPEIEIKLEEGEFV